MARVPHRACGTAGAPDLILVGQAEPALPKVWPLHRAPPPFVSGLLRRLCRVVLKPQLPRLRSPPCLRRGGAPGFHFGRAGRARPPQGSAAPRPNAWTPLPRRARLARHLSGLLRRLRRVILQPQLPGLFLVVAKSALLRFRLRRKLRPLPCSSSPRETRFTGLSRRVFLPPPRRSQAAASAPAPGRGLPGHPPPRPGD